MTAKIILYIEFLLYNCMEKTVRGSEKPEVKVNFTERFINH